MLSPTQTTRLRHEFTDVLGRYADVCVLISPPRSCSTAFARVLWEHPHFGFYSHEPFEVTYFDAAPLDEVKTKLASPLPLTAIKRVGRRQGDGLIIKEMPYQVGGNFPLLASFATKPLVFLIRDPRLNIASRMQKKEEVGDNPLFPLVETGWELIVNQIAEVRKTGISFLIVDATDFRNHPKKVFAQVFDRLGLPGFSPAMLSWEACDDVDLDNLGGRHRHLYRRVLTSTGLKRAEEPLPAIGSFPDAGGFRTHVEEALHTYAELLTAPERIRLTP